MLYAAGDVSFTSRIYMEQHATALGHEIKGRMTAKK
jgi:hypothetical protein